MKYFYYMKAKLKKSYIRIVNYIRVYVLDKPELDTPEKRKKDLIKINRAKKHYDGIIQNIISCETIPQAYTIKNMIEQFLANHKQNEMYVELKEKFDLKMEQLNIHI